MHMMSLPSVLSKVNPLITPYIMTVFTFMMFKVAKRQNKTIIDDISFLENSPFLLNANATLMHEKIIKLKFN